jgi:hypothetical protein
MVTRCCTLILTLSCASIGMDGNHSRAGQANAGLTRRKSLVPNRERRGGRQLRGSRTPFRACRKSVRLEPGTVFTFIPERCSESAPSKKIENHAASVALGYFAYNFIKIHRTLRMSPAMAAGVTGKLWEVSGLVQRGRRTSGGRKERRRPCSHYSPAAQP